MSPDDVLTVRSDTTTTASDRGIESPTTRTVVKQRTYRGLPVFGDWYDVVMRTSEWAPDAWMVNIQSRWTGGLSALAVAPTVGQNEAEAVATAAGDVPQAQVLTTPVLGYFGDSSPPDLAWQIRLVNDAKAMWLYYVSARSGVILARSNQVADNAGSLKVVTG